GPVVSNIYNLIREEPFPGVESPWRRHISEAQNYTVRLRSDPGNGELSPAEEELINEIFQEHGGKTQWALVELCHALPEWKDPDGSAIPIKFGDILRAGDRAETEIAAIEDELANLATVQMLVSAT
ncbi:MAG: Panacea domain-containing protein, partial [Acidobacteria bacterium]|nr:Panacea domain-containing protein [Acidobacteriota bacterium]